MGRKTKILVIGYGNPGRQDDGLGVMLVDELHSWTEKNQLDFVFTDSNYQLSLEDAATIADFDVVVFADASRADVSDFLLEKLEASPAAEFTMHAVSPAFILYVCGQIFRRRPQAFLLHIRGYKWEFMAEPSAGALKNLQRALAYMKDYILDYGQKEIDHAT